MFPTNDKVIMGTAPIQYDDYFLQLFKEGNDSAFEKVFKAEYFLLRPIIRRKSVVLRPTVLRIVR